MSSALIQCPVCGKDVAEWFINSHLDQNCSLDTPSPSKKPKFFHFPSGDTLDDFAEAHPPRHEHPQHQPPLLLKEKEREREKETEKEKETAREEKDPQEPWAERIRPESLEDFYGQSELVGQGTLLRGLLSKDKVPSLILWGPPGSGKTTLAKIMSKATKAHFVSISAVSNSVSDIKKIAQEAAGRRLLGGQRTTLFVDEIHRFNKLQQDVMLPIVEKGLVTLIGATTENPSFTVNNSLTSRCQVFVLHKLEAADLVSILRRAIRIKAQENPGIKYHVDDEALQILVGICDGDARAAINCLEAAVNLHTSKEEATCVITAEVIRNAIKKQPLLYDKAGEEHYNIISALHKSMRGSDGDAALYWLGRMLHGGENPLYIARRLIRFASEDVGLADSNALTLAVATYQACHFNGMPECEVNLAHCVAYLSQAPKSVNVYQAYTKVKETIEREPAFPVPLHIRNAPTKIMKDLGYGEGYKYNPDYEGPVDQTYLPEGLKTKKFLQDTTK